MDKMGARSWVERRQWRRRGSMIPAVALGVVALLLYAVPASSHPVAGTGPASTFAGTTCNPINPKNPAPSSLSIPGTNAPHAASGDLVNVSYEYRIVNYTKADKGVALNFPSAVAVFPIGSGGSLQIYLPQKTVDVSGSGWSSAKTFAASDKMASSYTFNRSDSAYLSTAKVAIMASVPTGAMTLEVRWHWTVFHHKSGHEDSGAWTVPTYSANGTFLASIFYPAAYVGIVTTSGSSVPSNTTYVVELNGSVASTVFRMVIEYPNNGTEIQSIYEYTPSNISLFNATVPTAFKNGTGIPSGNYLIHVHDSCNAIVHLLKVAVT